MEEEIVVQEVEVMKPINNEDIQKEEYTEEV